MEDNFHYTDFLCAGRSAQASKQGGFAICMDLMGQFYSFGTDIFHIPGTYPSGEIQKQVYRSPC
jgi:hypothetical protein